MEDDLFKLNLILLRSLGMYMPDPKWSMLKKYLYYMHFVICMVFLYGGILLNIQGIIWSEGNESIADMAINIVNVELFGSVVLRVPFFMKDLHKVERIADMFKKQFVHSTKFAFQPITMDFTRKVNDYFIKGWDTFVFVAGFLMSLAPIMKTQKELPFNIYTSYDKDDPLYYSLTVIAEFIAIEVMLFAHSNLDLLNFSVLVLTSKQIDILASDFANIIHDALKKNNCTEEEIIKYLSPANNLLDCNEKIETILTTDAFKRGLHENLMYCVKRHQHLLEFINEYQNFISPYMLVEVNFNFNYLIFVLFIFITVDNNSMYAPMSMYVSGITAQVFMMMFLGDLLSSKIEILKERFYSIPWYLCDTKLLKDYKFIQLRMSKPVDVSAGKLIPMSLDTFLEFMKKAFTFFTVLRQMNNN